MNNHYHFIGIGGIGMGAIAALLLAKGQRVSGSDVKENQMTQKLRADGALVYIGHDAANINGADYVIYSSAITTDNPEWQQAKAKNIIIYRRAQMLAELMQPHTSVTVAGAHGKTTTSSMAAHLLKTAGFGPTTAVGGILNESNVNAYLGSSSYFVAEVDESDGSFLYFEPTYSIITNIDKEHLDYYRDWDHIIDTYREFINKTKKDGLLIGCGDDPYVRQLVSASSRNKILYGLAPNNDIIAHDLHFAQNTVEFSCAAHGRDYGQLSLQIPGKHNVLNALSCVGLGLSLSIDWPVIKESLATFQGVKRRFQRKGTINDITVIDDYAHHPTEISCVLQAAAAFNAGRLVVVFQPHRYSRVKNLQEDFIRSLENADEIIITDIYAASETPMAGVSAENFVAQMKTQSAKPVSYCPKNQLLDKLSGHLRPGDMVLMLGAGDITSYSDQLVEKLVQVHKKQKVG